MFEIKVLVLRDRIKSTKIDELSRQRHSLLSYSSNIEGMNIDYKIINSIQIWDE
mgnify:CR=1 FL=1